MAGAGNVGQGLPRPTAPARGETGRSRADEGSSKSTAAALSPDASPEKPQSGWSPAGRAHGPATHGGTGAGAVSAAAESTEGPRSDAKRAKLAHSRRSITPRERPAVVHHGWNDRSTPPETEPQPPVTPRPTFPDRPSAKGRKENPPPPVQLPGWTSKD